MFGARFLDTINKSKTHPMILIKYYNTRVLSNNFARHFLITYTNKPNQRFKN